MRKYMRFVGMATLVATMSACGAGWQEKAKEIAKGIGVCALQGVGTVVSQLIPVLIPLLSGGMANWASLIDGLKSQVGPDAIFCALSEIYGQSSDVLTMPMASEDRERIVLINKRAAEYLKQHGIEPQGR